MYINGQRWDVSEEVYRESDRLGSSCLKGVLGFGSPSKKAADFGTATHWAALEPEKVEDSIAVLPPYEGEGAKKRREEFLAENEGKLFLTESEHDLVRAMVEAFERHPVGKVLRHKASVFESPITCEDSATGLQLKSKPDITLHHVVFNLKTAIDASAAEFERIGGGRLWRMGYAQQAAHEADAYSALTGEQSTYTIIAIEKKRPVRVALYEVSDHPDDLDRGWLVYGRRMNRAALTIEAARRAKGDTVTPRWWDREPIHLNDPMPFVAAEVGKFEQLAADYSRGVL